MEIIPRRKGAILRLEGFVLLLAATTSFVKTGQPLWWAAVIILLPDFLLTKRVKESKIGGRIYDITHTYPLPSFVMFIAVISDYEFVMPLTAITLLWFSHIGFDRLIGRGEKYDGAFVDKQLAMAEVLKSQMMDIQNNNSRWGD
ncbi:MAG: hypothetical protein RLZZ330_601 [Actinomycetota bacterium]|jgi:hypothetical protein